ncbi:hypothetical protein HD806DRAFT_540338 [Xylariaceae sp. AK1471]|nr:hypothetical protein HD806DRAFT_540338 [Xylariaceae sp. AK1471]
MGGILCEPRSGPPSPAPELDTESKHRIEAVLNAFRGVMRGTSAAFIPFQSFPLTRDQYAHWEKALGADRRLWGYVCDKGHINWDPSREAFELRIPEHIDCNIPFEFAVIIRSRVDAIAGGSTDSSTDENHSLEVRKVARWTKCCGRATKALQFDDSPGGMGYRSPDTQFGMIADGDVHPGLVFEMAYKSPEHWSRIARMYFRGSSFQIKTFIIIDARIGIDATITVWKRQIRTIDENGKLGIDVKRVIDRQTLLRTTGELVNQDKILELTLDDLVPGQTREDLMSAKINIPYAKLGEIVRNIRHDGDTGERRLHELDKRINLDDIIDDYEPSEKGD